MFEHHDGHPVVEHYRSRRDFLKAATAGVASLGLASLLDLSSVAEASISYPGFSAFAGKVKVTLSGKYLNVASDGMPSHNMMVGITSWQQQFPMPYNYSGSQAWKIPRNPVLAKHPISASDRLFRGAIALAVDGVPIFNAKNNRGDISAQIGELDHWGGHCGRGDDYHYHVAPLYLQAIVGYEAPIAYALDGFPLYGDREPDGSKMRPLDSFNGHFYPKGKYHYHGTTTYPYLNGGLRGEVETSGAIPQDEIVPQPTAQAYRPPGNPLPGAVITAFSKTGTNSYSLTYMLNGQIYKVDYEADFSTVTFNFIDPDGTGTTQTYQRA